MLGFSYFDKVKAVIVVPIILSLIIVVGCLIHSFRHHTERRRGVHALKMKREEKRGNSKMKKGLWMAAPAVLFLLDLLFPTISRTLLQFFSCRKLGSAGRWLEASNYAVYCDGPQYEAYAPYVLAAGVFYSCGIPLTFYYLVKRFKRQGQEGDKVVASALGWACT